MPPRSVRARHAPAVPPLRPGSRVTGAARVRARLVRALLVQARLKMAPLRRLDPVGSWPPVDRSPPSLPQAVRGRQVDQGCSGLLFVSAPQDRALTMRSAVAPGGPQQTAD